MKKTTNKSKPKIRHDRILRIAQTEDFLADSVVNSSWPQEMLISGNLELGKTGNPVTIYLEDEVTGEQLEISGVRNAFIVVEDTRKSTMGWLAMAVGSVDKMGDVLGFLSQTTLGALKKLARRG